MPDLVYTTLDITNEKDIVEYERAMFRAFQNTEIITLPEIWEYDRKAKRLRTKIPYRNQIIYIARLFDAIVAGTAINYNMHEPLQLEMIGFSIDKSDEHICEGLGVFCLQVFHETIPIGIQLKDYAFAQIAQKGIKTMYGTCSPKKLPGYVQLKFEVIDERVFKGEKKYLLKKALP